MLSKSVAEALPHDNLVTEIAAALRLELSKSKVISFARFMEMALYCPKIGYYEQEQGRIGARGDFYTSVSTGALFGELLARQFFEWSGVLQPFHWVEAGAHDGRLARDILAWLQSQHPSAFDTAVYTIIEPSARRRQWQQSTLERFAGKVRWTAALTDLPRHGLEGIIFSNELLDAFPVHRLGWKPGAGWFEWGVAWEEERFTWRALPHSRDWSDVLANAGFEVPPELQAVLPEGFVLEVSPSAGQWWSEAARRLRSGRLLTFDYGYAADELLRPERARGTLRAYVRHRFSSDLLDSPGMQDLTAHVNFTQLLRAGEAEGLRTEGLWTQARFLTALLEPTLKERTLTAGELRQFQTLTHPEHLGTRFRVLLQERGGNPTRS